ncbi:hypothetical protein FO519_009804 [Halicephalobus sp. NKZ332]|nr:hypothetical protein FO519_009804 [Halicephalobus sp. NKZ332]
MKKVFLRRRGVQFDNDHFLTDLMFADDSAIFADNDEEATDTLYEISRIAHAYDGSQSTVYLEGTRIEQVKKFKYLGSIVQEKKVAASEEVLSRIGQSTTAFSTLKWCLWNQKNITVKTKIRLFRTLVMPILLYGAETWTLLQTDLNKLEVFQMRCLRQILKVSLRDRIPNEAIRSRCEQQLTVEEQIREKRLRWFGHTCRMSSERLPRKLLWKQRPRIKAETITKDRGAWKNIIRRIQNHMTPTATYWLRGRPPPPHDS